MCDLNIGHQITHKAVMTACRPVLVPIFFGSTPRELEKIFCSNAMEFLCNIVDLGFNEPLACNSFDSAP